MLHEPSWQAGGVFVFCFFLSQDVHVGAWMPRDCRPIGWIMGFCGSSSLMLCPPKLQLFPKCMRYICQSHMLSFWLAMQWGRTGKLWPFWVSVTSRCVASKTVTVHKSHKTGATLCLFCACWFYFLPGCTLPPDHSTFCTNNWLHFNALHIQIDKNKLIGLH